MAQRNIIAMTKDQVKWVKAESVKLGISMTEVIRRLIDKARGVL